MGWKINRKQHAAPRTVPFWCVYGGRSVQPSKFMSFRSSVTSGTFTSVPKLPHLWCTPLGNRTASPTHGARCPRFGAGLTRCAYRGAGAVAARHALTTGRCVSERVAQSGITAVTSISTSAAASISALTSTADIAAL